MARILGVDIPGEKRIDIALRYIYGIGPVNSKEILNKAGIDHSLRAKTLNEQQLSQIAHAIQEGKYVIEGDLRREIGMNLKRLQGIKCYRGVRHLRGLPVRGQRTQTNARTRKGPRKTVGVQRNPNAKTGIH
ncbi:MAG TPA: 30S ribosomal protein S13 [Verrucomicrobiae bacterium]|jgi:small subunit ribosomal protein S13|nr:30S ribosomal protein S13 [Verrucomicrobiae bacterium]